MGLVHWLKSNTVDAFQEGVNQEQQKQKMQAFYQEHPDAQALDRKQHNHEAYYAAYPEDRPQRVSIPVRGVHHGIGRSGPKQALIDLLSTDDLDGLLYDCAPEFIRQANQTYVLTEQIQQFLQEHLQVLEDYRMLQGRYEELQQHYQTLQAEHQKLLQTLAKTISSPK